MKNDNKYERYMKPVITILCFLLGCGIGSSRAATLHGILFAATNSNIGKAVKIDLEHMKTEMKTYANAAGLDLAQYYNEGDACNPQRLTATIKGLQCQPDDVIFFYYTGHGTRGYRDTNRYPQLSIGRFEKDLASLYVISNELKKKGARLSIVMADCCNSYQDVVTPKTDLPKSATHLSKANHNTAEKLFREYKGDIIISSSEPGEPSRCDSVNGSAFTREYIRAIQQALNGGISADWDEILNQTRKSTKRSADHTPIFTTNIFPFDGVEMEIVATTPPVTPPNAVPDASRPAEPTASSGSRDMVTRPVPSNNEEESIRRSNTVTNELTTNHELLPYLQQLANSECDIEARIDFIDLLRPYFTDKAKIIVIGRDMKTIVSIENPDDYLSRLSTEEFMSDIVMLSHQTNKEGHITNMRVHEIYNDK